MLNKQTSCCGSNQVQSFRKGMECQCGRCNQEWDLFDKSLCGLRLDLFKTRILKVNRNNNAHISHVPGLSGNWAALWMVLLLTSHKSSFQQRSPLHFLEIVLKIYTHLWFGFSVVPVFKFSKKSFIARVLSLIFWLDFIICCLKFFYAR